MSDYISEIQLDEMLAKLNQLRNELEEEASSLQHASEPVMLDQQSVGRVSRGDALQQQSMAIASLGHCQERIRQIEDALSKIDNDEYGYCEGCGEQISSARLNAKPESPLCISCQEKQEQNAP